MEKTTLGRSLSYRGKILGYVAGKNHFQSALDATEALDFLVNDVDIDVRIHLRAQAPGLYRLARHHGLRPRDYINAYEIGPYAADHAHNKTDLQHHAPVAWHILHRHHLENKVFPQLQPA